jgi:pimeloyl-ACP methyl ester carboxylesterase
MPTIDVNNAHIYYQAYGESKAGQAPIVLIHGSTADANTDWGPIPAMLAKEYRVFAPDCRGHGRSNNPSMTYSFKELADDVAAFVHAMGYEKAHIIGHSNGGNVAVVVLMEHPEVVQTCIPQAANAYITRYLVEREPVYFDAARIERDEPDWMNEMIVLHGETNGKDYWRDLVWMTMVETMSEPNYTPAELHRVDRPVLVIMGAKDGSNARDEHAQYIANNIPNAEMWIPEKTGHNVHKEREQEWVERVLDFLNRKG